MNRWQAHRDFPLYVNANGRRIYEEDVQRWNFHRWQVGYKVGLVLRFAAVLMFVALLALAGSADFPNR